MILSATIASNKLAEMKVKRAQANANTYTRGYNDGYSAAKMEMTMRRVNIANKYNYYFKTAAGKAQIEAAWKTSAGRAKVIAMRNAQQ